MGAHHKSPSSIYFQGQWQALDKMIDMYPNEILGEQIAGKFSNRLPYLFKILAASKPLSIQAHPSREQAIRGFERENRQGIPLDAYNRNYRDDNHKPECICALSDFWALCGFRRISEMLLLFSKISPPGLVPAIDDLSKSPDPKGLRIFFQRLISMPKNAVIKMLNGTMEKVRSHVRDDPVFEWMHRLYEEYGNDAGVFSPVLLNLVCLRPGQALYLPSGDLHAYLSGLGIELMANSDNVLRGGLTPKYIDADELLNILHFEEKAIEILTPQKIGEYEDVYPCDAEEFDLSVVQIENGCSYQSRDGHSVEIMICIKGRVRIIEYAAENEIGLSKGQSVIVPAACERYRIEGNGVLYKASAP
jgi:mannose-6-phosphate isomerase